MTTHTGPLSGIRVVDLTRVLTGPWATMTLGDLGADVIKIEPPQGDDTRQWGPPFADEAEDGPNAMSAYFTCVNRNKRSLVLDLKSPEGQATLHKLIQTADVVVENYRSGVAEALGAGYEPLSKLNPKLIYCSISGYGRTGERAKFGGYDMIIQAQAGIMSLTGRADGPPHKVGASIVDITAGMNAVQAILAALIARGRTGKGERIDISLFDTQLQWLANVAANVLFSGEDAKRYGNAHPNIVPYGVFNAKDTPFVLAVGNAKHWQALCAQVLEQPKLATDPRFARNSDRVKNRAELIALLEDFFSAYPAGGPQGILAKISAAGIPCGKLHTVKEALDHTISFERNMRQTMALSSGVEIPMLGSPLHLTNHKISYRLPPPTLGEHTTEILEELNQAKAG
jgi:crotonobetainyl-CoA:carnitine CoA-transferase CaiB-like acyl-CoA transferase